MSPDKTQIARELLGLPQGPNKPLLWDMDILVNFIYQSNLEARIDENKRWADGYASAVLDNPKIDDPAMFIAAKNDFEDRIKELTNE